MSDENLYPHAPDVHERDTADDGFSSGWGFHFQTSEKYWIDCHVHGNGTKQEFQQCLKEWFDWAIGWRQSKLIVLDGKNESSKSNISCEDLGAVAKEDDRMAFLYFPGLDDTDPGLLEKALEHGARGLKLWSPTLVLEGRPYDEFEYPKWEGVFKIVNDKRLAIIWHVTQRMTDSPYTGGGRNAYWSTGWEKGVKYTNEDLLQSFLKVAKAHPDGHFIGAHQLHVGWDRLEEILDEYPNVYIDTSIGCFVRYGDVMYPEDQAKLRKFFIKYSDRILFGTDTGVGPGQHVESYRLSLIGHMLFIRQLRLPYDDLQKIAHGNTEKLFGIEASSDIRMGNIRP